MAGFQMGFLNAVQNPDLYFKQGDPKAVEDAYNSLKNSVEEYRAGLKGQAGERMTESLKTLGVLPPDARWEEDDTSDERVKHITAAVKLFDKGVHSASDFYQTIGKAVKEDYSKKITPRQRAGLEKAQAESKGKLASQYISTLLSPTDTGQGVANRLSMVNQTNPGLMSQMGDIAGLNPAALSDPAYAPYQNEIGDYVAKQAPGLLSGPLSNTALQANFAQDVPEVAAAAIPAIEKMVTQKESPGGLKLAEIPIEGKLHKVMLSGTEVVKDFGVVNEQYKKGKPIGRGWVTKKPIMEDPNTGDLIYSDSKKIAAPEDTGKLRPLTITKLPSGDVKELSDMRSTFNRLSDVETKASKMKDKFGPISGRWNKLKVKFQNDGPTQEVVNELKSMITIAYGLSGKQISYQEMQMLQEAFLPALEQPFENFEATLNFAKDMMASIHNNRLQGYDEQGYDVTMRPLRGKEPVKKEAPAKKSKFKIVSVQ